MGRRHNCMKRNARQPIGSTRKGLPASFCLAGLLVAINAWAAGPTTLFFDDFNGPTLNPIWQASLPNAPAGGGPTPIENYGGAPNYSFSTLGGSTTLHMTNVLNVTERRGWSSSTAFSAADFHYEVRFNTLVQGAGKSIDGFAEIWVMDAANTNRYDIVSPFEGGFGSSPQFFAGSSIDNAYSNQPFVYQNNTWYRLVLDAAPGQSVRASLLSDAGTELVGRTFAHDASAFGSGFRIVLAQFMGTPGNASPVDVAVDFARVTANVVPEPGSGSLVLSGLGAGFLWRLRAGLGALVRVGPVSTRSSYPSTRLGESGPLMLNYGSCAGLLDEVSIYNRALSASEVQSIYNADTAGKCVNHPPTASNLTAATRRNQAISIPAEKILLYASDPDGDPLVVTNVSATSTNAGSVVLGGGAVTLSLTRPNHEWTRINTNQTRLPSQSNPAGSRPRKSKDAKACDYEETAPNLPPSPFASFRALSWPLNLRSLRLPRHSFRATGGFLV